MMTKKTTNNFYRKFLPLGLVILLAVYLVLPQLSYFKSSYQTIMNADLSYIILAVIFFLGSYLASAISLCQITYFKLRYWPTLLVQVASGFTNKVVPAGVGAIATNAVYLIRQSKSGTKAGYVAGLNNLVGFVAHLLILIVLLIVNQQSLEDIFVFQRPHVGRLWILAGSILLLSAVFFWRYLSRLSARVYRDSVSMLKQSFQRPINMLFGLLAATIVTALYCLTLFATMLALNVHLSLLQTFLAFTVSMVALTITPTPGGVGGVEISLVAALISFGVEAGPALSVALVYRLITYWLPIPPGIFALELAIKRGYMSRPKHFKT